MPRSAHLRRLLEDFAPANASEERHRARILQLIEQTQQPFSRDQYAPGHVTASAFVLAQPSPEKGELLLILHGKLQLWLQPGGHVDPEDSDVIASARREVLEETGIQDLELLTPGVFDVDVHGIPARGEQPAHEHFDVRFLFTAQTREHRAGSDARAARWVPIAELIEPRASSEYVSDESVMRAVRKLTQTLNTGTRAWA